MAKPPAEGLKPYLLLALVLVSVVLVALTWADNLSDTQPATSGFVRGTAPAATVVVTANPAPLATPTATAPPTAVPAGPIATLELEEGG